MARNWEELSIFLIIGRLYRDIWIGWINARPVV